MVLKNVHFLFKLRYVIFYIFLRVILHRQLVVYSPTHEQGTPDCHFDQSLARLGGMLGALHTIVKFGYELIPLFSCCLVNVKGRELI